MVQCWTSSTWGFWPISNPKWYYLPAIPHPFCIIFSIIYYILVYVFIIKCKESAEGSRAYLQPIPNFRHQASNFCSFWFGQLWLSDKIMNTTASPMLEMLFSVGYVRRWPWMICCVSQHDQYIYWGFVKTELSLSSLLPNFSKANFWHLTAKFCWFGWSVGCRYALV